MARCKDTLYADFSDVEDCNGFANVYYFIHATDFLASQSGYGRIVLKRDQRIIEHAENIRKYFVHRCEIEFDDYADLSGMTPFSSVKKARRMRHAGIDVVFRLQFTAGFRKYGMIAFGMYPDEYIRSMKLKKDSDIEKFVEKTYPNIRRTTVINIRRGDKLNRKWRTCPNGRGGGFFIVNSKSVRSIIESKENRTKPILFISDDISWCKRHFSKYGNVRFLDKSYGNNKVMTDLYALSMCFRIYGDYECTFSQLGVILNGNTHVDEYEDFPHMFFVRKKTSDGFYERRKTRERRHVTDFRARQHMFNCRPIEMESTFNHWYYVHKVLIFLKDVLHMGFLEKVINPQ